MSYRSDVVLVVSKKAMPHFMAIVSTVPDGLSLCFQENSGLTQNYDGDEGSILFHWSGIKWYSSFAGVQAVEEFLDKMDIFDIDDDGWADEYRFVRLGEDDDDDEVRGYGFSEVYISRTINF